MSLPKYLFDFLLNKFTLFGFLLLKGFKTFQYTVLLIRVLILYKISLSNDQHPNKGIGILRGGVNRGIYHYLVNRLAVRTIGSHHANVSLVDKAQ